MSFLKKIQKVLALLSPWNATKPAKKKRKKKKKITRPPKQKPLKKAQSIKKIQRKTPNLKKIKKKAVLPKGNQGRELSQSVPLKKAKIATKKEAQSRKAVPKKVTAAPSKPAKLKRLLVGEVTHYFDRVKVAAFMMTGAPIALGDALEFEGKWGAFRQEIKSLQIDRVPVKSARAGDEVGILVKKPVREGDYVFKVL